MTGPDVCYGVGAHSEAKRDPRTSSAWTRVDPFINSLLLRRFNAARPVFLAATWTPQEELQGFLLTTEPSPERTPSYALRIRFVCVRFPFTTFQRKRRRAMIEGNTFLHLFHSYYSKGRHCLLRVTIG